MTVLNKCEKRGTHIDDVLTRFKLSGRYYTKSIILMSFLLLSNCMSCMNYVFTVDRTSYRCKDERFINNTCGRLANSTDVCSEWVYDDPHNFMAEFQLACQEWKRTLVGTVHNFGYGAGLLLIGPLSDKFGRKTMVVVTGVLGAILGVARSFSINYWMFITLEFLEAAFGDVCSPSFILLMEIVPYDKRVLSKMLMDIGGSFGYGVLPLLAWLFPYWRHLLRVLYAPTFVFFFYIFLIDESPRWLLSKGRKDEAVAVLEKMANKSKVEVENTVLQNVFSEEKEGTCVQHLKLVFKSVCMWKRFILSVIWFSASSFVSYGLKINSVFLPGNKYLNYGLFMVANIIGHLIVTYVMNRFRRKIPLMSAFILAAVICVGQAFVPTSVAWLVVSLTLIGKMMSTAFFAVTYIYTSEIFPTYARNSMHALCSSLGRVGSVTAPQTPLLMVYWNGAPPFLFGCVSLIAGLVTMFAPDTADDALPDTVRQAEALGRKHSETSTMNRKQSGTNLHADVTRF